MSPALTRLPSLTNLEDAGRAGLFVHAPHSAAATAATAAATARRVHPAAATAAAPCTPCASFFWVVASADFAWPDAKALRGHRVSETANHRLRRTGGGRAGRRRHSSRTLLHLAPEEAAGTRLR